MPDWLDGLGPKLPDIVAGFAGGVVNVFVMRRIAWFEALGSVVVGTLTAAYLGPWISRLMSLDAGVAAFLVGLSGMALCQGLIEVARRWRPNWLPPSGPPSGGDNAA